MVAVPKAPPVTVPVSEPILATLVLLLLHRPPLMQLVKVVTPPEHTLVSVNGHGAVVTVTFDVEVQPDVDV